MKKALFTALALAFGLPLLSQAAIYSYVATTGEVKTIEAPTADVAIAVAPNRTEHSGVALGVIHGKVTLNNSVLYQYVDNNGKVSAVMASNSEQALALSEPYRAENSGVVMSQYGPISSNMNVVLALR